MKIMVINEFLDPKTYKKTYYNANVKKKFI